MRVFRGIAAALAVLGVAAADTGAQSLAGGDVFGFAAPGLERGRRSSTRLERRTLGLEPCEHEAIDGIAAPRSMEDGRKRRRL